jgi:hypothetical protein
MEGITVNVDEIKERIIELNYYLISAINVGDKKKIEEIRHETNSLITLLLKK